MTFPSPVGGVSLTRDYAPSILFAALFGLLLPGFVYRLSNKHSRNWLIVGTFCVSIERVIVFSLRAAQVNNEQAAHSDVQSYMQMTFGVGVVSMAQDVVRLLRCLLVNTTYSSDDISEKWPSLADQSMVTQDQPRQRFWFRRYTDAATFLYLAAFASGTVAGSLYFRGTKSETIGDVVMKVRYVSSALALLLVVIIGWAALWSLRLPRIKQRGALLICTHALLLAITCTYRLSVLHNRTTSITSTSPGSLNTPSEKAEFYIFHVLPEWLSVVVLLVFNVREEIGTGVRGDWRRTDETPKQKAEREMKEQAKREREMKEAEKQSTKTDLRMVRLQTADSESLGENKSHPVRFFPKLYPKGLVSYV